jgi:cyanate permease
VAVLSAVIAYCTMSLLMTATPLSMTIFCGYTDEESSLVVQWHVIGMFAPSFFTGWLIQRLGLINVMTLGGLLLGTAAGINISGITVPHFFVALFLLGIGWNFLFVGATTLLTETYRPEEKAKIQALNDFLVFGSVGTASFMAGVLFHAIGWANMNIVALPLVVVVLLALTWLRRIRPSRGLEIL